jgi:phage FluMu protein Com
MMDDIQLELLIQKHINLMANNMDYQVLLDNIASELPKEPWEDIPGYSEEKANLLYEGDYWKVARWLVVAIQEDICPKCNKKLNGSFQLHHNRWGGDYFDLRIDKLQAIHHNCHERVHRINLRNTFQQLINSKENKGMSNLTSVTVKLMRNDEQFKREFDDFYASTYLDFSDSDDKKMADWLIKKVEDKGYNFVITNLTSQMKTIRQRLDKLGIRPIKDISGHGYLKRKYPNRKKKISNITISKQSKEQETYTKEEIRLLLKLSKDGLI